MTKVNLTERTARQLIRTQQQLQRAPMPPGTPGRGWEQSFLGGGFYVKLVADIAADAQGDAIPVMPDGTERDAKLKVWNKTGSQLSLDTFHLAVQDNYGNFLIVSAAGMVGCVATTSTIIPARSNLTPGGPVTVTRQKLDGGSLVDDGTVDVYSWVNSPSKDPAGLTDPDNLLLIYIEQDAYGTWWWTGEDCDPVSVSIAEGALSADTVITTTPVDLPGTSITVDHPGIYSYAAAIEIEVVGIPGNQVWDLTVQLYNATDSTVLLTWDFAGAGEPLTNPAGAYSVNAEMQSADLGDSLVLRAVRATITGTVTAIALSGVTPVTYHQLTGPLR